MDSPCDGLVVETEDGRPDHAPGAADREHPAGNHVVIRCAGARILLAHLLSGSVRVRAGDTVVAGQPIGQVGNSGNTIEPHLHIGAVQDDGDGSRAPGVAVPVTFGGRFLSVNSLVQRHRAR